MNWKAGVLEYTNWGFSDILAFLWSLYWCNSWLKTNCQYFLITIPVRFLIACVCFREKRFRKKENVTKKVLKYKKKCWSGFLFYWKKCWIIPMLIVFSFQFSSCTTSFISSALGYNTILGIPTCLFQKSSHSILCLGSIFDS